jgi:hypothetical protein
VQADTRMRRAVAEGEDADRTGGEG